MILASKQFSWYNEGRRWGKRMVKFANAEQNYYIVSTYFHKFPECTTYYIHGTLFLSSFSPLDIEISLKGGP